MRNRADCLARVNRALAYHCVHDPYRGGVPEAEARLPAWAEAHGSAQRPFEHGFEHFELAVQLPLEAWVRATTLR